MPLQPSAKRANIIGSLRVYINAQLGATFQTTAAGDAIDWGGGGTFDDTPHASWLRVDLMQPAAPRPMEGPIGPKAGIDADSPLARELWHMLNLNIFVRPAKLASFNRSKLETLRDAVIGKFMLEDRVEVKDYAGDSASLGFLIVDAIDNDAPVTPPDRQNELLQHNLVIALRWTETWTRNW